MESKRRKIIRRKRVQNGRCDGSGRGGERQGKERRKFMEMEKV
jgi:hypothetical protein